MDKLQSKYEILTDSGWSSFHGVRKSLSSGMVEIVTETGKRLECTLDHKIKTEYGFSFAKDITLDMKVATNNGYERVIFVFTDKNKEIFVYDALNVSKENRYYTNGILSHNCEFLGSSGTLISGEKLKTLVHQRPLAEREGISQYESPIRDHTYAMVVDVSRGKGLDYSAFSIIDITKMPYKQVCTFRDNFIGPVDFASVLHRMGKLYNEAHVLIEINDIGGQVADILFLDFGYESMLFTENAGRSGKRISGGFGKNVDRGIRTTKSVKSIGCSILKLLVEQDQLIINDFQTIQEISRFSKKGPSYEAESGSHDDLVMTLVLFAWLSDQNYFKDITDINTLMRLREKTEQQVEEDLLPFGYIDSGAETIEEVIAPSRGWLNF